MTNITRMPWMKKDYTATKRAFKKRLGIFDKDVALEEQEEAREAERILQKYEFPIERDEQHERELERQWEDGHEEREMERRLENQEQDRIEGDQDQRLLEEASERQGMLMTNILVSDEPITSKMPLETPLPSWEEAVRVIQKTIDLGILLVDEKEEKKIKQAWKRILQG